VTASILVLSNGHGEDEMGSLLAGELSSCKRKASVLAFPVVGEGLAYRKRAIPVVGVQKFMPSGGFILEGPCNLVADLRAGLLRLTFEQIMALRRLRRKVDWVIAVGDIYVLALAAWFVKRPVVFVPTAKTEYIRGHYGWEYRLMRRYARAVFPRDRVTAAAMQSKGVPARFAGNLMMDAIEITGCYFGLAKTGNVIGILPGSRQEAYRNIGDILRVIEVLGSQTRLVLSYVIALAPGLEFEHLQSRLSGEGWHVLPSSEDDYEGVVGRITKDDITVLCVQGRFGDVLNVADVVIGMAGTGNEQAAGMGKPVIAFPGTGAQFTPRFASDQKRLLGEALCLVPRDPDAVADEVIRVLTDREVYARMARAGKERMGSDGALAKMAAEIHALTKYLRKSRVTPSD